MWSFAVGLFLALATPGSLQLTAVYGLVCSVSVIAFGAAIGNWIDRSPRLKAAQIALCVQNTAVAVCCVLLIMSMISKQRADDDVSKQPAIDDVSKHLAIDDVSKQSANDDISKQSDNDDAIKQLAKDDVSEQLGIYDVSEQMGIDDVSKQPANNDVSKQPGNDDVSKGSTYGDVSKQSTNDNVSRQSADNDIIKHFVNDGVGKQSTNADIGDINADSNAVADSTVTESVITGSNAASWKHISLQAGVILSADIAALASLASKIAMEKDWIVVLSAGDSNQLAWMNSVFRSVDLVTLILSPLLVGQLITFISGRMTAMFIAAWNVVSMLIECFLLRSIYHSVPQLSEPKSVSRRYLEGTSGPGAWRSFFRSNYCLAGLALASLFLTVLGFDSVTIGYGHFQRLSASVLSGLMAAGALIGVAGSLCYTVLRKQAGIRITGLLGFILAVICQLACLASLVLPGSSFEPFVDSSGSFISVSVLFAGIVSARFGLWISDLSVTQLLQETVSADVRGAVSGVQGSLNMTLDTVKFALLLLLPRPRQFGWLVICSVLSWALGFATPALRVIAS